MSESVIELIQLENGDIELRHSDAPDAAVLTLQFSDFLTDFLQEAKIDVARAMIEAGIQKFNKVQATRLKEWGDEHTSKTVH